MENKILLVDADFYKDIADELVRGASRQLEEKNVKYENVPYLCNKFKIKKNLINPIYIS